MKDFFYVLLMLFLRPVILFIMDHWLGIALLLIILGGNVYLLSEGIIYSWWGLTGELK